MSKRNIKIRKSGLLKAKSYGDLLGAAEAAEKNQLKKISKEERMGLFWQIMPIATFYGKTMEHGEITNTSSLFGGAHWVLNMLFTILVISAFMLASIVLIEKPAVSLLILGAVVAPSAAVNAILKLVHYARERKWIKEKRRNTTDINNANIEAKRVKRYINSEIEAIREDLVGNESELGKIRIVVQSRLDWAKSQLAIISSREGSGTTLSEVEALARGGLEGIIRYNEGQRERIEDKMARVEAAVAEMKRVFAKSIGECHLLKAVRSMAESSRETSREIDLAFSSTVARLYGEVEWLSKEIADFSHQSAAGMLAIGQSDESFDFGIRAMEAAVGAAVDAENLPQEAMGRLLDSTTEA